MAIRVTPTSSSLNTSGYLHGVDTVKAIRSGVLGDTTCTLSLLGACQRDIPAFAYTADELDEYRNDFRSFIYQVPTGATVIATLTAISPNGTETDYTITDDTYGNLFTTGTVKSGVWAFILRWYNVADTLGYGCYKFNVTIVNSAATELTNYTTPCFDLKPWSCEASHRTVKITTHQRGYIVNGFDYRGIQYGFTFSGGLGATQKTSWPQELRWYGRFYPTTPTYINETVQDSFRNEQQLQSQYVENYTLRLDHLYSELSSPFFRDSFLAGEIYISNYWYNDVEHYDHIRVNPKDITDRSARPLNRNQKFEIELEEFTKATLKRH